MLWIFLQTVGLLSLQYGWEWRNKCLCSWSHWPGWGWCLHQTQIALFPHPWVPDKRGLPYFRRKITSRFCLDLSIAFGLPTNNKIQLQFQQTPPGHALLLDWPPRMHSGTAHRKYLAYSSSSCSLGQVNHFAKSLAKWVCLKIVYP